MQETVSVVAGGWSVLQVDLKRIPGCIIGVNDSGLYLPRCDIIVSMDRLWAENRYNNLHCMHTETWLRRSAVKNIYTKWPWLHVFDCDHESTEFSDDHGVLNGTNSGLCAFNKAYQLRPQVIYLFGFDMRPGPHGESYWYARYPWSKGISTGKLTRWAQQFSSAAKKCRAAGIDVINASSRSLIKEFPTTRDFDLKKLAPA